MLVFDVYGRKVNPVRCEGLNLVLQKTEERSKKVTAGDVREEKTRIQDDVERQDLDPEILLDPEFGPICGGNLIQVFPKF